MARHPALKPGLVQVAGVRDETEARMLLEEDVDWIGIPLRLTVNAEDLAEDEAAAISRKFPGRCCLITYLDQAQPIVELLHYLQARILQLHGEINPEVIPVLRDRIPGICIIKSLIIGKGDPREPERQMAAFAPLVDAFITDTYNPASGAEGATGLTHDWTHSHRLCRMSPRPVMLAGGLKPENLKAAIDAVQPFAVDAHTGVENEDGSKSQMKVRQFVRLAKVAFRAV